jgi:hypothetical protein
MNQFPAGAGISLLMPLQAAAEQIEGIDTSSGRLHPIAAGKPAF